MPFDAHKNFAISTVAVVPTPPGSGTSLTVAAGEGARFPAAPFNATVWAANVLPIPTNAEIVRVTARTGDVLTLARAQESSVARVITIGDQIAATITGKTLTDIESGTNFPALASASTLAVSGLANIGNALVISGDGPYPHLRLNTTPGADDKSLYLCSSGALANFNRGAFISIFGNNTSTGAGSFNFVAGNIPTGKILFTAGGTTRWTMQPDGALTSAPIIVGGKFAAFYPDATSGPLMVGMPGTGSNFHAQFLNANGVVGTITTNASATQYNTASDQRLKRDRGTATDLSVLQQTVVHDFDWVTDGTPGRGVFAQEAAAVAPPNAVTVGSDETDEQGRLTKPWGVDYAKYVPDLITGWQHHDAVITALLDRIARLEARLSQKGTE